MGTACLDSADLLSTALQGAEDGDEVHLCAGTYQGPFYLRADLIGEAGREATTRVGREGFPIVQATNGASVTLRGLSFEGASTAGSGGGIEATESAQVTVETCAFVDNRVNVYGGAIAGPSAGKVVVQDTLFSGNSAGLAGGAISAVELEATNVEFTENTANVGGAVWVNGGKATLIDSTFHMNTAPARAGALVTTSIEATNTTFSQNSATGTPGAVSVQSGTLTDCTFTGNTGDVGAALQVEGEAGDTVTLDHCVFENNTSNFLGVVEVTGGTLVSVSSSFGEGESDNAPYDVSVHVFDPPSNNRYDYGDNASFTCSAATVSCE